MIVLGLAFAFTFIIMGLYLLGLVNTLGLPFGLLAFIVGIICLFIGGVTLKSVLDIYGIQEARRTQDDYVR